MLRSITAFIEDTIDFWRAIFHWRLMGLLYAFYKLYWRGIVFASARSHRIVFANRYVLKKTGWKLHELRAKEFLDFVHPDDVENTVREMSSLDEGNPTYKFTNRYRTPSGDYVNVTWNAAIIGSWYLCEVEING